MANQLSSRVKTVERKISKYNNKEQGQLPKNYLFKSNIIVTLAMFLSSLTGRTFTNVPLQYTLMTYNWSLTVALFCLMSRFIEKRWRKHAKNKLVILAETLTSAFVVYYSYTLGVLKETPLFEVFMASFFGFVCVFSLVVLLFIRWKINKTGADVFYMSDETLTKVGIILIVAVALHQIYMSIIYGVVM